MSLQNQMAQSVAYAANVVTRAPLSASPTLNHMILSCMYDTVACKSRYLIKYYTTNLGCK